VRISRNSCLHRHSTMPTIYMVTFVSTFIAPYMCCVFLFALRFLVLCNTSFRSIVKGRAPIFLRTLTLIRLSALGIPSFWQQLMQHWKVKFFNFRHSFSISGCCEISNKVLKILTLSYYALEIRSSRA